MKIENTRTFNNTAILGALASLGAEVVMTIGKHSGSDQLDGEEVDRSVMESIIANNIVTKLSGE